MWPIFRLRERDLACHSKGTPAGGQEGGAAAKAGRSGEGQGSMGASPLHLPPPTRRPHLLDIAVRIAPLAEEVCGVLAALGGGRANRAGGVRELGADADLLDGTELRGPDLSDHAARPDVRVLEDLVERVDGADAGVPLAQLLEPLVAGLLFELCSHVFEAFRG